MEEGILKMVSQELRDGGGRRGFLCAPPTHLEKGGCELSSLHGWFMTPSFSFSCYTGLGQDRAVLTPELEDEDDVLLPYFLDVRNLGKELPAQLRTRDGRGRAERTIFTISHQL